MLLKNQKNILVHTLKQIWITTQFTNAGDEEEPIITFHLDGVHTIIPNVVRKALHLLALDRYNDLVGDDEMKRFLTANGYQGSLAKMGNFTL